MFILQFTVSEVAMLKKLLKYSIHFLYLLYTRVIKVQQLNQSLWRNFHPVCCWYGVLQNSNLENSSSWHLLLMSLWKLPQIRLNSWKASSARQTWNIQQKSKLKYFVHVNDARRTTLKRFHHHSYQHIHFDCFNSYFTYQSPYQLFQPANWTIYFLSFGMFSLLNIRPSP